MSVLNELVSSANAACASEQTAATSKMYILFINHPRHGNYPIHGHWLKLRQTGKVAGNGRMECVWRLFFTHIK
jgi:hypothetical protein